MKSRTGKPMIILLVEDDPGDARLLGEMFNGQDSHDTKVIHAGSMIDAERYMAEHTADIILLDLGLPDVQGLEAVRRARAAAPNVPLVVLTGLDDESLAVQTLQKGAQDYLVKNQIETPGLLRALRYAIGRMTTEAELRAAKNRAEQAETLLQDAVDSMSEGFVIYDQEGRFVMCNESYRQIYAERADRLVPGMLCEDTLHQILAMEPHASSCERPEEFLAEQVQSHLDADHTIEQQRDDGSWLLATDRRMKNGNVAGLRINITALKHAEVALHESEARLDRAQAIAGIGSWELDVASGCYIWSKELYRIRGVSPLNYEPNVDNVSASVHPDDYPSVQRWLTDLTVGVEVDAHEARIVRPDGEVRLIRSDGRAVIDPDGVIRRLAGTMKDITDRRLIERQLAQAQKMEAVGNLTGGMAHDFNNGLAVIIGNLDLLGRLVKTDQVAQELCDEARLGAHRCAELVRLLLAFARRQPLRPQRTDVNAPVENIAKLLSRTLGEDVRLTLHLEMGLPAALTDPVQLEAALTNLANNARDAMPRGGNLSITTKAADLDEQYAALHQEVSAGEYVLIEVSDTGTGIAPEIINSIFEPFFTTKETGRGSGLGLSMVFGFVTQSGGHLAVHSEVGRGSTFRIYLPCIRVVDTAAVTPTDPRPVVGGSGMVLVVEDNAALRRATARQLSELGYQVREAEDAAAALVILGGGDRLDMLFSDVVMPGKMDGVDLALFATRARPNMKVLLTSGFPGAGAAGQRIADCPFLLLHKPYGYDELAHAVHVVFTTDDTRLQVIAAEPVASEDQGIHNLIHPLIPPSTGIGPTAHC
jgi:two-component system cell cycle sensor histidine kinase/response regulator CckA